MLLHDSRSDPAKENEQLAALLRALAAPSASQRLLAAEDLRLQANQAEEAIPHLITAFADDDLEVRAAAVRAVAAHGKRAVPALILTLQQDPQRARAAILTLGEIGPEATLAIDALTVALEDSWLGVCAAEALVRIRATHTPPDHRLLLRIAAVLFATVTLLAVAGLATAILRWAEIVLFGISTQAAEGAVLAGGVGTVLGGLLALARRSPRAILLGPVVFGLFGAVTGLVLGGLFGGMVEPVIRALARS